MKILFATGEAFPFIKTGGLGDVSYSLPKALVQKEKLDVLTDVVTMIKAIPFVIDYQKHDKK